MVLCYYQQDILLRAMPTKVYFWWDYWQEQFDSKCWKCFWCCLRTWTWLGKLLGGATTDEQIVLFLDEIHFFLECMQVMMYFYFAAFLYMALSEARKSTSHSHRNRHNFEVTWFLCWHQILTDNILRITIWHLQLPYSSWQITAFHRYCGSNREDGVAWCWTCITSIVAKEFLHWFWNHHVPILVNTVGWNINSILLSLCASPWQQCFVMHIKHYAALSFCFCLLPSEFVHYQQTNNHSHHNKY